VYRTVIQLSYYILYRTIGIGGMERLQERVAVVTGAASGIGRAMAVRFAAEGMRVALADVEAAPLAAAVEEIRASGGQAIGVETDVRFESQVQALANAALAEFGAVHLVCNNAGVETGGPFAEIPSSAWKWVLDVNVLGVVHGCRVFLPLLRAQDEGHIVNTGSGASFSAQLPTFAPYIASKFAVLGLSESLDMELRAAGENIGVTLLEPIARTNMSTAERNRPADVPSSEGVSPLRTAVMASMGATDEKLTTTAADIADLVVRAVRERRFYALFQPQLCVGAVRTRLRWMETGEPAEQWNLTSTG
jgi:NAD(P)-dependent dehydrogenase (short-subunit alcohol dehydrogenase family)